MLGCKKLKLLTFTRLQSGQHWLFFLMWSFANFEFAVLCCLGSRVCRTVCLLVIWKMNTFFINPSEVQQTENDSVQFDDILKRIGEFGPWQRAIYILSCVFVLIPSGLHTAGVPFITGTPKFQCVTPDVECEVNKCCKNCTNYAFIGPYAYNSTVTEVCFFI